MKRGESGCIERANLGYLYTIHDRSANNETSQKWEEMGWQPDKDGIKSYYRLEPSGEWRNSSFILNYMTPIQVPKCSCAEKQL